MAPSTSLRVPRLLQRWSRRWRTERPLSAVPRVVAPASASASSAPQGWVGSVELDRFVPDLRWDRPDIEFHEGDVP
jgi:hypothetical protein